MRDRWGLINKISFCRAGLFEHEVVDVVEVIDVVEQSKYLRKVATVFQ